MQASEFSLGLADLARKADLADLAKKADLADLARLYKNRFFFYLSYVTLGCWVVKLLSPTPPREGSRGWWLTVCRLVVSEG